MAAENVVEKIAEPRVEAAPEAKVLFVSEELNVCVTLDADGIMNIALDTAKPIYTTDKGSLMYSTTKSGVEVTLPNGRVLRIGLNVYAAAKANGLRPVGSKNAITVPKVAPPRWFESR